MAKWKSIGENISIVLIVIGVLGMCQPYAIAFYTYSFTILLVGTLTYIVIGHI